MSNKDISKEPVPRKRKEQKVNNPDRKFKGIWIPAEVWLSNELTMQEKLFYVEIDSLDNKDGCYAKNKHFADFFGISTVRVSKVINSLCEKGLIISVINIAAGNERVLRINQNYTVPSQIKVNDPLQTFVNEGHQQKLMRVTNKSLTPIIGINNTDINTDNDNAKPKKPDPLADPMIDLVIEAWNKITGQDIQKTTVTHRKNIAARLKENPSLTIPDFEMVIAGKFKEWNKEPEAGRTDSRAWITTNTIIGSKFDGYLNSLRMLQKRQVEIDRRAQEDVAPLAEDLMARAGWKP